MQAAVEAEHRSGRLLGKKRFGIDGDEPRSLRDLSGELRIARESLRQIELQALRRLGERAAGAGAPPRSGRPSTSCRPSCCT